MGLNLGFGANAAQGATNSVGWGAASTGITAFGDVLGGIGKSQLYGYQSQLATNNAAIEQQNAQAALNAGQYQESASKLRTGELVSAQRAAQGANGTDVAVGSPVAVRSSTQAVGSMDAAMIHYNAARQAYAATTQASAFTAQAQLDKMAGANAITQGLFGATSTILGGATSLGSKWSQYRLAFGAGSGGGAQPDSNSGAPSGSLGL